MKLFSQCPKLILPGLQGLLCIRRWTLFCEKPNFSNLSNDNCVAFDGFKLRWRCFIQSGKFKMINENITINVIALFQSLFWKLPIRERMLHVLYCFDGGIRQYTNWRIWFFFKILRRTLFILQEVRNDIMHVHSFPYPKCYVCVSIISPDFWPFLRQSLPT